MSHLIEEESINCENCINIHLTVNKYFPLLYTKCYIVSCGTNFTDFVKDYKSKTINLNWYLTLILPTTKILAFAISIEPGQTAQTVWPGCILLADQLQVFILISLKMIMDKSKNRRWIFPFMKLGMVRVNTMQFIILRFSRLSDITLYV